MKNSALENAFGFGDTNKGGAKKKPVKYSDFQSSIMKKEAHHKKMEAVNRYGGAIPN